MSDPLATARRLLAEAKPGPGEDIEIFVLDAESRRYEISGGRLENSEARRTLGAAVRVLAGRRLGFAYRADIRGGELAAAVAEARELARRADPDPARELPEPAPVPISPAPPDLSAVSAEHKLELARRVEAAALGADPRVRAAHQATYQEEVQRLALVSTRGMDLAWSLQEYGLAVSAVAEAAGDSQIGDEYRVWRDLSALDPELVGRTAGEKAAGLLGAVPAPTQVRPLLIPPALAVGLLEAALPAWSAESVQRGRSFLAGREGRAIASACVTLADDGTLPGGLGTAPVDDEGTPARRTDLIRSGALAGWLHNQETGRRAGAASTGNARRPGLLAPPAVGPSNIVLRPGTATRAQLLAQAEGGLLLAELLGLHTLDPVSGDFSLGAAGWLIAGGEAVRPVRGVTIAGSVLDLLGQVAALGLDLTAYGRFSAPTILVRDIMVAGV